MEPGWEPNWGLPELINAPADTARLSVAADAPLFAATPTILTNPATLRRWHRPLFALFSELHNPYFDDTVGIDQPWRLLAEHVGELHVTSVACGTAYLAHTSVDGRPRSRAARARAHQ